MFTTVMATPMLAVQGKYALLTQQDSGDKTKKRHVIIDSDTLAVRGTFEGETGKEDFEKEIKAILAEGTAANASPLEKLMASTNQPVPDDETATA